MVRHRRIYLFPAKFIGHLVPHESEVNMSGVELLTNRKFIGIKKKYSDKAYRYEHLKNKRVHYIVEFISI